MVQGGALPDIGEVRPWYHPCFGDYSLWVHALVVALQGVVAMGMVIDLPLPGYIVTAANVVALSLLKILFACIFAGVTDLYPIWYGVLSCWVCTEVIAAINQALLRVIPFFCTYLGVNFNSISPPPSYYSSL